jgi:hypothetical protein
MVLGRAKRNRPSVPTKVIDILPCIAGESGGRRRCGSFSGHFHLGTNALVTAVAAFCRTCNRQKGAQTLDEWNGYP